MKENIDRKLVYSGILIATYTIILYLVISRYDDFSHQIKWFISLFVPFIYAIGLSYILNLIMIFVENNITKHLTIKTGQKRGLSILLAFLIFIFFITITLMFVLPQLLESVGTLIASFPTYIRQLITYVNELLAHYDIDLTLQYINTLPWQSYVNKAIEFVTNSFTSIFQTTLGTTIGITSLLFDLLMAISISIYMLADKEKLIFQMKKIVLAIFPNLVAQRILNVSTLTNQTLKKYLSGQLIEAGVLGLLCFAGLLVLRIPYAILLSTIIGVTALVPVLGPTIGNLVCAFILLMIKPIHALVFFIYINVLQQIDNSFIYPKIVGESIGLSGLWVLMAILVGGKLFGLIGVILGVPFMAVFYSIAREFIHYLLQRRNINESDIT